ncbi:hypothetical protein DM48_1735 [Burkholderia gladioli]|uniref:Uncharacterized protein n=1 Tax=Burkholderia gladioli TaxID=28095 RepID=A0AAW3EXA6_BURGA|nr:hypothetical protein DM48_1735 [Burkholderia gladioli]
MPGAAPGRSRGIRGDIRGGAFGGGGAGRAGMRAARGFGRAARRREGPGQRGGRAKRAPRDRAAPRARGTRVTGVGGGAGLRGRAAGGPSNHRGTPVWFESGLPVDDTAAERKGQENATASGKRLPDRSRGAARREPPSMWRWHGDSMEPSEVDSGFRHSRRRGRSNAAGHCMAWPGPVPPRVPAPFAPVVSGCLRTCCTAASIPEEHASIGDRTAVSC